MIKHLIFWLISLVFKYILLPFLFIWSTNSLFHMDIPFSFKSWLAIVILIFFLRVSTGGINIPLPSSYENNYEDEDSESYKEEEIARLRKIMNEKRLKKKRDRKPDWDKPA